MNPLVYAIVGGVVGWLLRECDGDCDATPPAIPAPVPPPGVSEPEPGPASLVVFGSGGQTAGAGEAPQNGAASKADALLLALAGRAGSGKNVSAIVTSLANQGGGGGEPGTPTIVADLPNADLGQYTGYPLTVNVAG